MDNGNKSKHDKLGMPFGTANGRLRKALLFDLAGKTKQLNCFRCGKLIERLEEFSIDHKVSWLYSDNPRKYFFDIENIAFSHPFCNNQAGAKVGNAKPPPNRKFEDITTAWCSICRVFKNRTEFSMNAARWNGVADACRSCRKDYRRDTFLHNQGDRCES